MSQKRSDTSNCRLRVDPVLVDKFRRLQGGIGEVGTKIVRDLGLQYFYNKQAETLDIVGADIEILNLAVETLRFWVDEDEFPTSGTTCHVGYPNRCTVIWRFHGDYAKKFDHLFSEEIAHLKTFPTVNIKAVPSRKKPEYVEVYCHFSVYRHIKDEISKISDELEKVFQEDFFIPKSDLKKAKDFAKSKRNDDTVLYALKEYPDKVRVWMFARNQSDVLRARKELVNHVGIIDKDKSFVEPTRKLDNEIETASFIGQDTSSAVSEKGTVDNITETAQNHSLSLPNLKTAAPQLHQVKSKTSSFHKDLSPRVPKIDNSNYPRPADFPYPVQKEIPAITESKNSKDETFNPFTFTAFDSQSLESGGMLNADNASHLTGESLWTTEVSILSQNSRKLQKPQSRIYVHHQVVQNPQKQEQLPSESIKSKGSEIKEAVRKTRPLQQRGNPAAKHLRQIQERHKASRANFGKVNNMSHTQTAVARKKSVRSGEKEDQKSGKPPPSMRRRPALKSHKQPQVIKYHINVNGLNIYMYKQSIVKVAGMDTLVNVVTSDLKHGDVVAQDFLDSAGQQVTDEVDVHRSLNGDGETADNIVTSAGKLPALGIIHVVSPIWKHYTVWEDCAADLHRAVYTVLKTAEAHKYRKIALPAIGAEPRFGIPKDLVAEVYVKALMDYSMGMGPMYPVLEAHLVDTDTEMLTYIKDAYESWAATPGVADDMTKHIKTDSKKAVRDPQDVSDRSQSAVNLKDKPSHRSENMVTFVGQSYTNTGEQKWTFDVLKRLTVHVYTGSVVQQSEVDAIACGVDANGKGTVAKTVLSIAGKTYAQSLKDAIGNRALVEAEILVCDGGGLGIQKVLHSVISAPIYTASQKNLSRLDTINTQLLHTANKLRIKRLAIPLLGTGRLRERFEVEQCSLQLVDNIIELCLRAGSRMKINEIHLVNANHVMTQYLTQALRTRAHTKLRIEAESDAPSRSEVLTSAEAAHGNVNQPQKAIQAPSENMKDSVLTSENEDERELSKNIKSAKENDRSKAGQMPVTDRKFETDETDALKAGLHDKKQPYSFERKSQYKPKGIGEGRKKASYLCKQNLETHNKLLQEARKQTNENDFEDLKRDIDEKLLNTKTEKSNKSKSKLETKSENNVVQNSEFRHKKTKRIIQRSSDAILQKTKADTYSTLHERKQRYSQQASQSKVMKLKSSDELHRANLISKSVVNVFEKERLKLLEMRQAGNNKSKEITSNKEKETMRENSKKILTRQRADKYQKKVEENEKNKILDKTNAGHEKRTVVREVKSDQAEGTRKTIKTRTKRHFIDTEREDRYMMDMDFHPVDEDNIENKKEKDLKSANEEEDLDKSCTKSERSRQLRRERFLLLTGAQKKARESKQHDEHAEKRKRRNTGNDQKLSRAAGRFTRSRKPGLISKLVTDKLASFNLDQNTRDTRVEPVRQNNIVDRRRFYKTLENSLKPKVRKFNTFKTDLRIPVPNSVKENGDYRRYSERDFRPAVRGSQRHYSCDAIIPLPSLPRDIQRNIDDTDDIIKACYVQTNELHETVRDAVKTTDQQEETLENQDNESYNRDELNSPKNVNNEDLNVATEIRSKQSQNKKQEMASSVSNTNSVHNNKTVSQNIHELQALVLDESKGVERSSSETKSLNETEISVARQTPSSIVQQDEQQKPIPHGTAQRFSKSTGVSTKRSFQTYTMAKPTRMNGHTYTQVQTARKEMAYNTQSRKHRHKLMPIGRVDRGIFMPEMPITGNGFHNQKPDVNNTASKSNHTVRKEVQQDGEYRQAVAPRSEDVVIRDKIRLDIGIVDQKEEAVDPEKIEAEKKKIKRFWEVVGGKDVDDESIYTMKDSPRKDKMLVAKVKKERVMSAKSKSSKKSKMSSVHDVGGNYSLTLEVN